MPTRLRRTQPSTPLRTDKRIRPQPHIDTARTAGNGGELVTMLKLSATEWSVAEVL